MTPDPAESEDSTRSREETTAVDLEGLCNRIASRYFVVLGLAVLLWWGAVFLWPSVRYLFFPTPNTDWLVSVFAVPDICIVGIGSLVASVAIRRKSVSRSAFAWSVAAALIYATAICVGWTVTEEAAWLGTGLMITCSLVTLHAAILISRNPLVIFRSHPGSTLLASTETLFQMK